MGDVNARVGNEALDGGKLGFNEHTLNTQAHKRKVCGVKEATYIAL